MPASLTSDAARGPGYGIIQVPGFHCAAAPTFVLQRSSDGQCLSPNGWQAAESPLSPEGWDSDSGALRMAVGPHVVDSMDALDTYRVMVSTGDGQKHTQTLLVQDLVYSSMHGGRGMLGAVTAPPAPAPAPEPEPLPEPEPAPELLDMPPPPPVVEEKRSKAPLLIGLLVLLLAAGGGLWWYLQQQKTPATAAQTEQGEQSKQGEQAKQPEQATPAATPKPAETPPTPKLSPLQAAREHLRTGGDAAKGLELAKSPDLQNPEAADAVFLLVEDAAQKGQVEAMLLLGAFYDPTDKTPKGSIKPDPAEALHWYQKAKDAGQASAEGKITALRQWQESQKTAPAPVTPPAPADTATPATPAPEKNS